MTCRKQFAGCTRRSSQMWTQKFSERSARLEQSELHKLDSKSLALVVFYLPTGKEEEVVVFKKHASWDGRSLRIFMGELNTELIVEEEWSARIKPTPDELK